MGMLPLTSARQVTPTLHLSRGCVLSILVRLCRPRRQAEGDGKGLIHQAPPAKRQRRGGGRGNRGPQMTYYSTDQAHQWDNLSDQYSSG